MTDFGIDFGNDIQKTNEAVSPLFSRLKEEGVEPGFLTNEIFQDDKFNESFLRELTSEEQYQYLKNTSLFEAKLKKDQWLIAAGQSGTIFGVESTTPESVKANGEIRSAESGKAINTQILREDGIDPTRVLIFRATQPSDTAKPELYWTTDYFETRKGLAAEMGTSRETAIILVSNLDLICSGGAIKDRNDDNGLPIRRIDSSPFDQKSALGIIRP